MSRSRKAPVATQRQKRHKDTQKSKRLANKRVRQTKIGDGGEFKRASNSWDINDWSFPDTGPRGTFK